jgi:hypothetical protein
MLREENSLLRSQLVGGAALRKELIKRRPAA